MDLSIEWRRLMLFGLAVFLWPEVVGALMGLLEGGQILEASSTAGVWLRRGLILSGYSLILFALARRERHAAGYRLALVFVFDRILKGALTVLMGASWRAYFSWSITYCLLSLLIWKVTSGPPSHSQREAIKSS